VVKREAEDGVADAMEEANNLQLDLGSGMGKGNKKNPLGGGGGSNEANLAELQKEMDKMKIGSSGPPVKIPPKNPVQ